MQKKKKIVFDIQRLYVYQFLLNWGLSKTKFVFLSILFIYF